MSKKTPKHSQICDGLYINTAEKILGRKLTDVEYNSLQTTLTIFARSNQLIWYSFKCPFYNFPYDLLPPWVNGYDIVQNQIQDGHVLNPWTDVNDLFEVFNEDLY